MTVNEGKTEVMFPGKKFSKLKLVRICWAQVKGKRKVRYLGVDLDSKGTMEGHIKSRAGFPSFVCGNTSGC